MADHVLQIDAAERLSEFLLGGGQNRKHDFDDQLRVRLHFGCVDRSGGAKNIVCRYGAALARKLITAVRTAAALEDSIAHERLLHRFQMPRRQAMVRCESLGGYRPPFLLQRHINVGV